MEKAVFSHISTLKKHPFTFSMAEIMDLECRVGKELIKDMQKERTRNEIMDLGMHGINVRDHKQMKSDFYRDFLNKDGENEDIKTLDIINKNKNRKKKSKLVDQYDKFLEDKRNG